LLASKASVRAGKCSEVRRIFAPKFCKLVRKNSTKLSPKKKKASAFDFWRNFFKSKHIKDNFAPISPNLTEFPQTRPRKIQKSPPKLKRTSASDFGHDLFQIKAHQMISQRISHFIHQISLDFAKISRECARIFTRSKHSGVRLYPMHPRLLHKVARNILLSLGLNTICVKLISSQLLRGYA